MLKVLVVEDELYVRKGIVMTVDWAALDCMVAGEAANGEEGLAFALQYSPDLIITDIRMPRMDGIEMLTRLREEGCGAAVVILTAYGDFEYAQQALRLGAVDYLLKPFHDGELEKVVQGIHERLDAKQSEAVDENDAKLPALQLKKGVKNKYVAEAAEYIAAHYNEPSISVGSVASDLGISEGHLSHVFKRESGYTLMEYLLQYRMHIATRLLKDCRLKVYEVADMVGYRDIAYFSSAFRKLIGLTPSEYQAKSK